MGLKEGSHKNTTDVGKQLLVLSKVPLLHTDRIVLRLLVKEVKEEDRISIIIGSDNDQGLMT